MFTNFEKLFKIKSDIPYNPSQTPLENLRAQYAGSILSSGLLRILKREDVVKWRTEIALAFPKFANRFEPFAFDWLGRFFCINKSNNKKPSIFIFNISYNRCLIVPCDLTTFLEEELPKKAKMILSVNEYLKWIKVNKPLNYSECVGFNKLCSENESPLLSQALAVNLLDYWIFMTQQIDARPYNDCVIEHYHFFLGKNYETVKKIDTVMHRKYPDFTILKYFPNDDFPLYRYITLGMSSNDENKPIELYMLSQYENDGIIDILTWVAFYHNQNKKFELCDTINLGEPWHEGSKCAFGLVSLPHIDPPEFKDCGDVGCLWLLPITKEEYDFANKEGIFELEKKFSECELKFVDFYRDSVVK